MNREEAINVVKCNMPEGRHQLSEALRTLIPELQESEDERIRREMIEYFHGCIQRNKKSGFRVEQIKGWIAYIERQKEYIEDIRQYAYNKGLVDAEEKHKPAEWSEEDEIEHDYLCKLLRETWDKVDKGSCIDDAITWLEKLPERICLHSWKPSEKQIGILGKVFAGCQLKDSERDSMVDLFYHLKDMI